MRKAITIALDLDECLVHTFNHSPDDLLSDPMLLEHKSRFYVLDYYDDQEQRQVHYVGVRRPHLDRFLRSVNALADIVIVYTAADEGYAVPLVRAIFDDRGITPPQYIFSRRDCAMIGDQLTKPLVALLQLHPSLKARTDLSHMIMLDDREANFALNKENGLVIPAYEPEPTPEGIQQDDRYLLAALEQMKRRVHTLRYGSGLAQ